MHARLAALGSALIVLSIAASAVSSLIQRDLTHTNDVIAAFPVELLAVLVGGVAAWSYLQTRSHHASSCFGVGVYLLVVAAAISTVLPRWLPTDNAVLGAALLAGLLAADGASLTLVSSATLGGWSRAGSTTAGLLAGFLAFLAVTAGGMFAPLLQLQLPLLVTVVVTVAGLLIAGRARTALLRPLVAATIGSIATIVLLVARGPDDWASASTSLKLYSLPIVLMSLGVSLVILATTHPSPAHD